MSYTAKRQGNFSVSEETDIIMDVKTQCLVCFFLRVTDLVPRVSQHASHHTSYTFCDGEQVSDSSSIQQLVLKTKRFDF